jgi:hypothetical protein
VTLTVRTCRNNAFKHPSVAVSSIKPMIWFFDKDGERLRYEITRDKADGRYRVVITHPDGTESVEEVDEPTELIERSVQLMNSLRGDGWRVA